MAELDESRTAGGSDADCFGAALVELDDLGPDAFGLGAFGTSAFWLGALDMDGFELDGGVSAVGLIPTFLLSMGWPSSGFP